MMLWIVMQRDEGQWEKSEIAVGCKCRGEEVSGRRVR